ncbi:hypothetical protein JHK84_027374 [Glycine max]|uniref:Uncharacterized protein n=2 Tax=Glycine subgen. Soja TaxID=1462606 RepID=K7LHT9_SOYBN|nr:hypothetical protein JHK84_027374 [Glycine max]KAH1137122.1 hypothetical protein GYH30_027201 [Glycine max]RZB86068.1 Vacuolar cation/proton exchanger 1 [Glycine soja]
MFITLKSRRRRRYFPLAYLFPKPGVRSMPASLCESEPATFPILVKVCFKCTVAPFFFCYISYFFFAFSLLGLAPLAERVSFLTELTTILYMFITSFLILITSFLILALHQNKVHVVKLSLLGSILSNLLLVLGSSLLYGGLANLKREQRYDRVCRSFIVVCLWSFCWICGAYVLEQDGNLHTKFVICVPYYPIMCCCFNLMNCISSYFSLTRHVFFILVFL